MDLLGANELNIAEIITSVAEVGQLTDVPQEVLVKDHFFQGLHLPGVTSQPFCAALLSVLQRPMWTGPVHSVVRVHMDITHVVGDGDPFLHKQVRVAITGRSTPPQVIDQRADPGLDSPQFGLLGKLLQLSPHMRSEMIDIEFVLDTLLSIDIFVELAYTHMAICSTYRHLNPTSKEQFHATLVPKDFHPG